AHPQPAGRPATRRHAHRHDQRPDLAGRAAALRRDRHRHRPRTGARAGRPVPKPRPQRGGGAMRTIRARLRREGGSVLIAGLLLTVALLMLLGAAVDIGHAFIVRRDLTAQADDAALAGSQALSLAALHHGKLALDT